MKHKILLTSILAAANVLNIGCMSTVSSTYSDVKRSLTSKQSAPEPLYGQVPEKDRIRVKQLEQEYTTIKQTHLISKLEEQMSDLRQERSENEEQRLYLLQQEHQLRIKLARLEAIDRNQLGDKIDNLESITDVHVGAIKIQQKRLKYQGAVSVLDVKIDKLELAINDEKNKLSEMTTNEQASL